MTDRPAPHLALPGPCEWLGVPLAWESDSPRTLQIHAGPQTDRFFDPQGAIRKADAPALLFAPDPLFTLSAGVRVGFGATYDAAALLVMVDEQRWAKLCFEYSPQQQPMVVSVVTNGLSDDCNSAVVEGDEVDLRITRLGSAFAFHYSLDGQFWSLVRYFALPGAEQARAGFSAQSPTGEGCSVLFRGISYRAAPVADIRSGV